jgi:hypothetical protein
VLAAFVLNVAILLRLYRYFVFYSDVTVSLMGRIGELAKNLAIASFGFGWLNRYRMRGLA